MRITTLVGTVLVVGAFVFGFLLQVSIMTWDWAWWPLGLIVSVIVGGVTWGLVDMVGEWIEGSFGGGLGTTNPHPRFTRNSYTHEDWERKN